ncbi:Fasciclin-like arabinogalactan protein 13 [Turnera subulata]|uniref:Fasciclin-like arabinogalactan protein 13 n=1 Tax=Turnera subulata TaxID=218843 RepID=A0A9Q0J3U9_9ROSI|nr:Fasciclin-like arabinogalactan protein 13 [Turnera subulata]
MAATSLPLLSFLLLVLSLRAADAQTPSAPAPGPAGPINITAILEKNGQYTTLIRLLNTTQIGTQLTNQLNSSTEGLTLLAPTDNAFNTLPSGSLNNLDNQQQVQLILYHVLPKFYTLSNLLLVSNPVRTQATGEDGVWGLNFTGQGNQVNVSSGLVQTPINNALRQDFPLAVYQVDKVLLPEELFGVKPPSSAPAAPAGKAPATKENSTTVAADGPSPPNNAASGGRAAFGLIAGLGLACVGLLA